MKNRTKRALAIGALTLLFVLLYTSAIFLFEHLAPTAYGAFHIAAIYAFLSLVTALIFGNGLYHIIRSVVLYFKGL